MISFSRYLDMLNNDQEESLEKHRFLVQAKTITANEFEKLSNMKAVQDRADEVI